MKRSAGFFKMWKSGITVDSLARHMFLHVPCRVCPAYKDEVCFGGATRSDCFRAMKAWAISDGFTMWAKGNRIKEWRNDLTVEDVAFHFFRHAGCRGCPAHDYCRGTGWDSCLIAFRRWAGVEVGLEIPGKVDKE